MVDVLLIANRQLPIANPKSAAAEWILCFAVALRFEATQLRGFVAEATKLNLTTLAVVIIALSFFVMDAAHLPWTTRRIAGIAIAAPAFFLFVAARLELGRAFSVQAKATTLVTTGLYSRIRNPIYVFGGVFILGIIIWAGRPWWLLILAILIPLQAVRSRKEERIQAKNLVLMPVSPAFN